MLKAVLFDLDGTLLPMNEDEFTKCYFGLICKALAPRGYNDKELLSTILAGTKAMIKNDGSKTNEEAFWQVFASEQGEDKLADKKYFDQFYVTEFLKTKITCKENPFAKEIVDFCHSAGLKVILASNPLFPRIGMITRLTFVGLEEKDFDYITSYEICKSSKPSTLFYKQILEENGLEPSEVLMFGNSGKEDCMPALECGIKTYLVGDYLKNTDEIRGKVKHIGLNEVIGAIKENM